MSDPSQHPRFHKLIFDTICWIFDNGPDGWETRLGDALNEAIVVVGAVLTAQGDPADLTNLDLDDEPFMDEEVRQSLIDYVAPLVRARGI